MLKISTSIIAAMLLVSGLWAQELNFSYSVGVGSYKMDNLKPFNDYVKEVIPFETKIVSNFPPYFYYQPMVSLRVKAFQVGVGYAFHSTGSRVSSKDYSGEYSFDTKVNSHSPILNLNLAVYRKGFIRTSIYAESGVDFSRINFHENLYVLDTQLIDDYDKYKAFNINFEAGITVMYEWKKFGVGINTGYLTMITLRAFHVPDNKNYFLIDPVTNDKVNPMWDGLRFGITISYCLNKAKEGISKEE